MQIEPHSSLKGDNWLFSSAPLSAHPDGIQGSSDGPETGSLSSCSAPNLPDPIPLLPDRRRDPRKWTSPDAHRHTHARTHTHTHTHTHSLNAEYC